MAKPKPEKKPMAPTEQRVLPMLLKIDDRLVDATGEYEVVGRPTPPRAARMRASASSASTTPTSR
jgi:hypothetical protein